MTEIITTHIVHNTVTFITTITQITITVKPLITTDDNDNITTTHIAAVNNDKSRTHTETVMRR